MGILVIVWIGLIGFCIWGATQSYKNEKKRKQLQNASDISYKTTNGKYSFHYIIKGFDNEKGKLVKVLIQPVLGFSDLAYSNTVVDYHIIIKHKNNDNISKEYKSNFKEHGTDVWINVILESEFKNNDLYEAKISLETTWSLGGNIINEKIDFDYKG